MSFLDHGEGSGRMLVHLWALLKVVLLMNQNDSIGFLTLLTFSPFFDLS